MEDALLILLLVWVAGVVASIVWMVIALRYGRLRKHRERNPREALYDHVPPDTPVHQRFVVRRADKVFLWVFGIVVAGVVAVGACVGGIGDDYIFWVLYSAIWAIVGLVQAFLYTFCKGWRFRVELDEEALEVDCLGTRIGERGTEKGVAYRLPWKDIERVDISGKECSILATDGQRYGFLSNKLRHVRVDPQLLPLLVQWYASQYGHLPELPPDNGYRYIRAERLPVIVCAVLFFGGGLVALIVDLALGIL